MTYDGYDPPAPPLCLYISAQSWIPNPIFNTHDFYTQFPSFINPSGKKLYNSIGSHTIIYIHYGSFKCFIPQAKSKQGRQSRAAPPNPILNIDPNPILNFMIKKPGSSDIFNFHYTQSRDATPIPPPSKCFIDLSKPQEFLYFQEHIP